MSSEGSPEGTYCVVMRTWSRLVIDPGEAIGFNASSSTGLVHLRIFTNHVEEGHEVAVPRELVIQAVGPAPSLNAAISSFYSTARPFGDILAFCSNATVGLLEPHIAWDDTVGRTERDFMEVYLRDDRGLPLPGRRLKLAETGAVLRLMGGLPDRDAAALVGVMSRYGVALSHWYLGGETAAFTYLWFAVEALTKLVVSRKIHAEGSPDRVADKYGMVHNGSVSVRSLEAFLRRNWVFQKDPRLHDDAFEVSNGIEHASMPLGEIHPKTAVLAPAVFSVLRGAVLRLIDPDGEATAGLLTGRTALPLDTVQRRIVRGQFVNVLDELAHPDLLYPVLEWSPKVDSLARTENGDYNMVYTDKLTVRCAPEVQFRAASIEIRGRPDGSAGDPPSSVSIKANVQAESQPTSARDKVMPFMRQLQQAVGACGPVESHSEFTQPDGHLLEIFNMMRGSYRGCMQLLEQGLPEEALILGRTVFRDAMRLHQAAGAEPAQRAALAFGWKHDSAQATKRLFITSSQDGGGQTEDEDRFENLISALTDAAQRFGVEDFVSFRPASRVAEQLDDADFIQIDRLATAIAEGYDLASHSRRQHTETGVTGLHDTAPDSWVYPLAAKYVGGSYLLGAKAALTLFEWEDPDEKIQRAEQGLEALEERLTKADES